MITIVVTLVVLVLVFVGLLAKLGVFRKRDETPLPFLIIPKTTEPPAPKKTLASALHPRSPYGAPRRMTPIVTTALMMGAAVLFGVAFVLVKSKSKPPVRAADSRADSAPAVAPYLTATPEQLTFGGDTARSADVRAPQRADTFQGQFAGAAGTLPPPAPSHPLPILHDPSIVNTVPLHVDTTLPLVSRAVTVAPIHAAMDEKRRSVVIAGASHTCVLSPEGDARCWGANRQGQLGPLLSVGKTNGTEPKLRFATLSAGVASTCALTIDGDAYCWGTNERGQLGDGTRTPRAKPVRVASAQTWTSIALGASHACAVSSDARVWCWGDGRVGQLGNGNDKSTERPVAVAGAKGIAFASVVAGGYHSCALTRDGVAYCWGENGTGALGDGTTIDRAAPVAVRTDKRFVALAGGYAHTCGVTTAGAVLCWGQNQFGQLGNGALEHAVVKRDVIRARLTPTLIHSFDTFIAVAAGDAHTCALARDNTMWCWGNNTNGQLGDESVTDRYSPVKVAGGRRFVSVAAAGKHTCGMTTTDELMCWGANRDGEVGDGTRQDRLRPVVVDKRVE